MSQDEQYPERGYNTEDVAALRDTDQPKASFARRHWGKLLLLTLVMLPVVVFTVWSFGALNWSSRD